MPRRNGPVRGAARIGERMGRVITKHKRREHFGWEIPDRSFRCWRKEAPIQEEEALDGGYVIRTPVGSEGLDSEGAVRAYKNLSQGERAFWCLKTVGLEIRPIDHHVDDRIRAHVFLLHAGVFMWSGTCGERGGNCCSRTRRQAEAEAGLRGSVVRTPRLR